MAMADELESSAPWSAIKCLEAVAQCQHSVLPTTAALARLRLGRLLLQHTDCVQVAKTHLERAVRDHLPLLVSLCAKTTDTKDALLAQHVLVTPLAACDDLKCRILSALATCYRLSGPSKVGEEAKALQQGVQTAEKALKPSASKKRGGAATATAGRRCGATQLAHEATPCVCVCVDPALRVSDARFLFSRVSTALFLVTACEQQQRKLCFLVARLGAALQRPRRGYARALR